MNWKETTVNSSHVSIETNRYSLHNQDEDNKSYFLIIIETDNNINFHYYDQLYAR